MDSRHQVVHVHPENDTRRHTITRSGKCWCRPKHERIGGGVRVTHNSDDEREFIEENLGELLAEDKKWAVTPLS
jgi:hypothetical protein